MTVSPDARTPSATVHDLSGSTPPGAARIVQPFGIATAVAVAVTPAQTSPLHQLRAEHDRVAPLRDTAYEAWNAADERYEEPPLPDALSFRAETDASSIGSFQNRRKPFGYTDASQIEMLRKFAYSRPVHIARRDEIVAAHDDWAAACEAARAAAGIDAARDHHYALSDAASAIRRQVIDARATSIDDLWHKVAVVLECFDGTKGIEEEMAEGENQGSATREVLGLSILLDLGRMLGKQGAVVQPVPCNLVPTTLPQAPVSDGDDAPLLDAVREFCRVDDMQDHLCLTHDADTDKIPGYAATEEPWQAWLDAVADRPALTWEGVVAKAETMKRHTVNADLSHSDAIGESMAEDILRLAGRTWDDRSDRVLRAERDVTDQRSMERAA